MRARASENTGERGGLSGGLGGSHIGTSVCDCWRVFGVYTHVCARVL